MPEAHEHHQAEQSYAFAAEALDGVIETVRVQHELVIAATESSDPSALFAYVYQMLRLKNRFEVGSFQICEMVCAAALTRLVYTPKTEDPLEKLLNDEPQ